MEFEPNNEISKSRVWDKVPEGSTLAYFWRYPKFSGTQRNTGRWKPVRKKSARSVQPFRYNTDV